MRPTRIRVLAATAAVVAVLAWSVLRVWDARIGGLPRVPWSTPGTLAFFAAVLLGSALSLRGRLRAMRERRLGARPVNPLSAARLVVLAKASSLAGSVFVGVYGGYALLLLVGGDPGLRRDRLLVTGLAFLAGLAVVTAALVLERVCRVPPAESDEGEGGGSAPLAHA